MNIERKLIRLIVLGLLFIGLGWADLSAQKPVVPTRIKGLVVDSLTREPLPYTAVFLKGSDLGVQTDENGSFDLTTKVNFINVRVSTMGYTPKEIFVNKGSDNDLLVELVPAGVALQEVVVKPGKESYSKKNNPAVAFVEKLIARRQMYDPKNHDYYSYDKYEKTTFALNDFSEKQKDKWLFKKFKFVFDYLDTSEVSGKPILNVSVTEKFSNNYYRKSPHSEKEYITGVKHAGVDEIFDEESVKTFVEDVFREVDVFEKAASTGLFGGVGQLAAANGDYGGADGSGAAVGEVVVV